jgi:ATP-binding cassette subfamily B protein
MIIVLDEGTINGVGTHDELLKTNKIYQEVYYSQNKVGDSDAN